MITLPIEIQAMIVAELARITGPKSDAKTQEAWLRGATSSICRGMTAGLARYSTVSKTWQSLIECHTFKSIEVTPTETLLLRSVVRNRSRCVKTLSYEILFSSYEDEGEPTAHEAKQNSQIFNAAIKELFAELAQWPVNANKQNSNGLELVLNAHSPSDFPWLDQGRPMGADTFYRRNRAFGPYFQFLPSGNIVSQRNQTITKLVYHQRIDSRVLRSHSICVLASLLPNLRSFEVGIIDRWMDSIKDRKASRAALAKSMLLLPTTLQECSIHHYYSLPRDLPHNDILFTSSIGQDALSCGFRQLSQRLTILRVSPCIIGPDFFWPVEQSEQQSVLPLWPNLKLLDLEIYPILADGSWLILADECPDEYFGSDGNPLWGFNDGDSDSDWYDPDREYPYYDYRPIATGFDKLYLAAAAAAEQMPKLEKLCIRITESYENEHNFLFILGEMPYIVFRFREDDNGRSVRWVNSDVYEPSAEVIDAWKKAKGDKLDVTVKSRCVNWNLKEDQ